LADTEELPPSGLLPASGAVVPHARLLLALILIAALGLRLAFVAGPWSGLALDFHSHFGAWAVGEPAERFATDGFGAAGWMRVKGSVELAEVRVGRYVYAHHPALYTILVGLSLKTFGLHEWAVRLVPLVFSMLALFATWRFVARWFGQRAALFAAALLACVPYLAWYGMLAWTEGALIWIAMGQLGAYARWLEERRPRFLVEAALWQLLAGLFDWSGAFLLLGIGLHALVFRVRRLGLRACLPLLVLPLAFGVAALVHAVHMRGVMSASERLHDTKGTLALVTTFPTSFGFWLDLQVRFAWRFLGAPAFVLAGIGALRALFLAVHRRLGVRDALVLVALVPGLCYVGLFPQRSINHDFFLMLSLPGIAILGAAGAEWLAHFAQGPKLRAQLFTLLLIVTAGVGLVRSLDVASARSSDQMPRIAAALDDVLDDPEAVVLTHIGRGMALPFYARAELVHSVDTTKILDWRLAQLVTKLAPDRPAYFLFDLLTEAQLASDSAAELLGNPAPSEVAARFTAFAERSPQPLLDQVFEAFMPASLSELHRSLRARFPARLVTVDELGVFEIFDLRSTL
jgi:hypothetical protein